MNKFIEQLHAHRSIREYNKKKIPSQVMETILSAATAASSSGNMQAYSIIVTTDESLKNEMAPAHFNQSMITDAPAFITFCADFNRMRLWIKQSEAANNFDNSMSFMIGAIDAVLASQNCALAAESMGLGICYMGTTLASADKIGEILNLPENVVPVVGFSIGYSDEKPEHRERLALEAIVHQQKYKQYEPKDIEEFYKSKEIKAMKRYQCHPHLKQLIDEKNVENLAQVYTQVKYTQKSHVGYSKMLKSYLKKQNFLNDEFPA